MKPIKLKVISSKDESEFLIEDRGAGTDIRETGRPAMDAKEWATCLIKHSHCAGCQSSHELEDACFAIEWWWKGDEAKALISALEALPVIAKLSEVMTKVSQAMKQAEQCDGATSQIVLQVEDANA